MQPAGNVEPGAVLAGNPQVGAARVKDDIKALCRGAQADGTVILEAQEAQNPVAGCGYKRYVASCSVLICCMYFGAKGRACACRLT